MHIVIDLKSIGMSKSLRTFLFITLAFCFCANGTIALQMDYNKSFEITGEAESLWNFSDFDTVSIRYSKKCRHTGKYFVMMDGFHSSLVLSKEDAPYLVLLNVPKGI